MSSIHTDTGVIALDENGFVVDLADWSESVAMQLAQREGLELTDQHWEIIYLLRRFYADFTIAPAMRVLIKQIKKELGAEKASSVYLLGLFPGSPAKISCKIAGLPKPTNCL